MTYHVLWDTHAMRCVLGIRNLEVQQFEIDLFEFIGSVDPISLVLCGLISGLVVPDRRGCQFPIRWGICIEGMFEHGTR